MLSSDGPQAPLSNPSNVSSVSSNNFKSSKNLDSSPSSDVNSNDTSLASLSLIPVELRKYERCRLDSFKEWPPESGMDPKRLAKAGFFSTGIGDQVKCFSCHGIIKNWHFGDVAIAKHKTIFPLCQFIKGLSDNVPLNSVSCTVINRFNRAKKDNADIADKNVKNDCLPSSNQNSAIEGLACCAGGCPKPIIVDEMAPHQNSLKLDQRYVCNDVSNVNVGSKGFKLLGQKPKDPPIPRQVSRQVQKLDINRFKRESERLKSFEFGWKSCVPPHKLAQAGFYFTFTLDKVQCAFCNGIVGNWERNDDPLAEHVRHFPLVSIFTETQCGDDVCNRYKPAPKPELLDESALIKDAHLHSNFEELGIQVSRPTHPAQATIDARLRSFTNPENRWPAEEIVSAESLTTAGFFYVGVDDSTRCFHCNGGLTDWEKGDDPWVRTCSLVSKMRDTKPRAASEQTTVELKVDDLMNSSVVTNLLDIGILRGDIRRVLQAQLQETGTGFSTASELLNAIHKINEPTAESNDETRFDIRGRKSCFKGAKDV
ncbi:Inhibitor of apoptosis protein [Nymphon striatum]|nr:Inhibitor of apoptosis protein [Nymphon striatum]